MDAGTTHSASHSCPGRPDIEGAATRQGGYTFAAPAHTGPAPAECSLSDAESVGRPAPPLQAPSSDRLDSAAVSGPVSESSSEDTQAVPDLTLERFYRLLSRLIVHICLAPSSSVGEHPAALAVGAVVQSAFHGVEPPPEWLGAVVKMPPQTFQITGLAEIRRWLRRAVSEWQHCAGGPDAAQLEGRIKNLLNVRDMCKRELGKRYPAWMGAMLAASWGATPADWAERSRRQTWLAGHLKLTSNQVHTLRLALAEFKAGNEESSAAAEGGSSGLSLDGALRGVATGAPGVVERYVRLDDAIVETVSWQQCVATCAVLFPYATEKVSLIEALVAAGPTRENGT